MALKKSNISTLATMVNQITSEIATSVAHSTAEAATRATAILGSDITHIRTDLERLSADMREGFLTTHQKQDKTNGRVTEAEKDIALLQQEQGSERKSFDRQRNGLWLMVTTLVGIIVFYMTHR